MTELEAKEQAAYRELKRAKVHLEKVEKRLRGIEECLDYKFTARHYMGGNREFIEQFYSWLRNVEAIGFKAINRTTAKYRKAFRNPTPRQMREGIDPTKAIASLKLSLQNAEKILERQKTAITDTLPGMEARAHRLKIDRLIIAYGKASVDLTKVNIRVAIWVPVGTLILALAGIIAFETFKPEIVSWIRHVIGLASTPK